jgi:hypothetical protein
MCFVIIAFLPITLYYKTVGCVISLVGAIYGFMNTFRRIDDDEYTSN